MASRHGWIGKVRTVLLTGSPGVGKTTMVKRFASNLVERGLKVTGITTSEVRENGVRTGFRIADLATGEEGWLARKDSSNGPRIGSYRVIIEDLERIGVHALETVDDARTDFAIVDEVGPMEMTSPQFRSALVKVLHGAQPNLATVKFGSNYSEIEKIRDKCLQLVLTSANGDELFARLTAQADIWVRERKNECS